MPTTSKYGCINFWYNSKLNYSFIPLTEKKTIKFICQLSNIHFPIQYVLFQNLTVTNCGYYAAFGLMFTVLRVSNLKCTTTMSTFGQEKGAYAVFLGQNYNKPYLHLRQFFASNI